MDNTVKSWKEEISRGIQFREEVAHSQDWPRYRDYYRGRYDVKLFYNLIYGLMRTVIPNIYFRNPYIDVNPTFDPKLIWHAKLLESVDNYLLPQLGMKKTIKKCAADAFLTGSGFNKVGYDSLFGFDPKDVTLGDDKTLTAEDKRGNRIEYNTYAQKGMPWVARVPPDNIVLPWGATSMDELEWIGHIVFRPVDDVRLDSKYTGAKDIKGSHIEFLKGKPASSKYGLAMGGTNPRDWVELVEIRDFKRGEIKVIGADMPDWLREPQEDILQFTGLPFNSLQWSEDPEWAWGISEVAQVEPQQDEVNETREMLRRHRVLAVAKFLSIQNGLTPETKAALESNKFGAVLETLTGDLRNSIMELTHAMPADLASWVDILRSDMREIIGLSKAKSGEYTAGGSHRTGYEVARVEGGGDIRLDEKRDAAADFVVSTMKMVNQVIFSLWTEETVTQMVGQDGAVYWVQYTPSAIKGDYTLKIDLESLAPPTKATRKAEIMEVLGILSRVPNANINLLVRILLKEFDWANAMELFPPAQTPPMGMEQFVQQQGELQANPKELLARRAQNANVVKAGMVR